MSMTLNLVDRLMAKARNFEYLGRDHDAAIVLNRLSRFRLLPAKVAQETQTRLGRIYLDRRKFRKARRCLTAALSQQPDDPRSHYFLASAYAEADDGDQQRAAEHYRKSLALDPDQPDCLCDYGQLLFRLGDVAEGLRCYYRAAELAPHDPEVLSMLVNGLEEEGRFVELKRILQIALFRNARDARFRQMWVDFQFRRAWQEQRRRLDATTSEEQEPVVLPFAWPALKLVRQDAPESPAQPHASRRTRTTRQA